MKFGDLIKVTFRGPSRGPSETIIGLCLNTKSLPVSAFDDPVKYISVLTSGGIRHFPIMMWDFDVVSKLCNPSKIHDILNSGDERERKRR